MSMLVFLVFLVLPSLCAAFPQDLTDKMFTFPDQTNIAHVKLNTTYDTFKAVTVCLKSFTDLQRAHVLFSMTNPANNHAFAIFKISSTDSFYLHVASYYLYFSGHQYKMNSWNHLCATWDSKNGLAQMWVDGQPTTRKLIRPEEVLKGSPIIMIGQWQTSRGGFETSQSFVGMMSEVHMWDYVLPSCEIQRYMINRHFTPGNVVNWRALEFDTVGKVVLEDIGCIY